MAVITQCPECGATYASDVDSCRARFDQLLALDHSRQEPWGPRHGQAFAAFALQHPTTHRASLDAAWVMLYRIYCLHQPVAAVIASARRRATVASDSGGVPARLAERVAAPRITIADLGEFMATTYPERLDDWCRASLAAWGANAGAGGPA
ncbi:MAG: DUF5946 family protein [Gemmatimonadaceae bacterium]